MSAQDSPMVYTTDSPPPVSDDEMLNTLRAAIPAAIKNLGNVTPGVYTVQVRCVLDVYAVTCKFAVVNAPLCFAKPYRLEQYGMYIGAGMMNRDSAERVLTDFLKEAHYKLTHA